MKTRKAFLWFLVLLLMAVASGAYLYYKPTSPRKGRQKAPSAAGQTIAAQVLRIKDGDTVRVQCEGVEDDVRLWGIDAPEKDQPFAAESTKALSDLVVGREVTLQAPPQGRSRDLHDRRLSVIFIGKKNVNLALVEEGLAWWYRDYAANDMALEKAEAAAKARKSGLWQGSKPVPPWEWRKAHR